MSDLSPAWSDPWLLSRPGRRRVEVDELALLEALLCASLAADLLPSGLPLRARLLAALEPLRAPISPDLRRLLRP